MMYKIKILTTIGVMLNIPCMGIVIVGLYSPPSTPHLMTLLLASGEASKNNLFITRASVSIYSLYALKGSPDKRSVLVPFKNQRIFWPEQAVHTQVTRSPT